MSDYQSIAICVGEWIMMKGIACNGFEAMSLSNQRRSNLVHGYGRRRIESKNPRP